MNAVDSRKYDIALNDDNDIDLNADTGSLNTISGKRELAQKISNLLNINRGEIDWNRKIGMNQYILLMNDGNPTLIQQAVSQYLHTVFGKAFRSCRITRVVKDKVHRAERVNLDVILTSENGQITVSPDLMIGGN